MYRNRFGPQRNNISFGSHHHSLLTFTMKVADTGTYGEKKKLKEKTYKYRRDKYVELVHIFSSLYMCTGYLYIVYTYITRACTYIHLTSPQYIHVLMYMRSWIRINHCVVIYIYIIRYIIFLFRSTTDCCSCSGQYVFVDTRSLPIHALI